MTKPQETSPKRWKRSGPKPEKPANLLALDHRERRANNGHLNTQRSIGAALVAYQQAKEGSLIDDTTPLTPEETKFAIAMNEGHTLAECYQAAWPEASKDLTQNQLHKRGYTVSRRASILRYFLNIAPESVAEKRHTARRLQKLRRTVLEQVASDPEETTSQRLRAIQLLGQLPDVEFTETDEAKALTTQSDPEAIKKAILELISKETKGS